MNKTCLSAVLLSTIIFFAGCSYQSIKPRTAVSPDSILQINQAFNDLPINDLPNGSKLYFQSGKLSPSKTVDWWQPYCVLYVFNSDESSDYLASVQLGKFDIIDSLLLLEVVKNDVDAVQVASLEWHGRDLPSYIVYQTKMALRSDEQPAVKSLTCAQTAGNFGDYHLTLNEIRQALGQLMELGLGN